MNPKPSTPDDVSEQALWLAACDGNAEALERLCELATERFRRFFRSRGVLDDDNDDLVQQTLVVMLDHVRRRWRVEYLAGYLGGLGRQPLRDYVRDAVARRDPKRLTRLAEMIPHEATSAKNTPSEQREIAAALRDCLRPLSPTNRLLLQLRYLKDMPVKSVAEELGITANAAALRVYHVLPGVRDCLNRKGLHI